MRVPGAQWVTCGNSPSSIFWPQTAAVYLTRNILDNAWRNEGIERKANTEITITKATKTTYLIFAWYCKTSSKIYLQDLLTSNRYFKIKPTQSNKMIYHNFNAKSDALTHFISSQSLKSARNKGILKEKKLRHFFLSNSTEYVCKSLSWWCFLRLF